MFFVLFFLFFVSIQSLISITLRVSDYLKKYLETSRDTVESYSSSSSGRKRRKKSSKSVQNVKILDDEDDDAGARERQGKRRADGGGGGGVEDDDDEIVRFVTQQKNSRATDADEADDIVLGEEGPVIVGERSLLPRDAQTAPTSAPRGTWVTVNIDENTDDNDNDNNVARHRRHDSDNEADNEDDTHSPVRRRHDSDNDESPPRRRAPDVIESGTAAAAAAGDLSPPRRSRGAVDDDSDLNVPRKRAGNNDKNDDSDSDLDVPRRATTTAAAASSSSSRANAVDAAKLALASEGGVALAVLKAREVKARMSSGVAAGLQSAADLRADTERLRKEEEDRFAQLDDAQLGRGTAAVVRDRKGRRLTEAEIAASRAPRADADADVNMEWGKGLVQRAEQREARAALLEARDAPFARRIEDNDERLKAEHRWGDPMLGYTSSSTTTASKAATAAPVYRGPVPTNRFNIRPGPQWDGVDRSNGQFKHHHTLLFFLVLNFLLLI